MHGRRIRQVLLHDVGMSRALIRRLRENNRVRLNNLPVFLNQFVQAGDVLNIDLDFAEESCVAAEPMDLDIVYEDSDFLALNKPPGVIVHPVGQETTGTLANGVMYYWLAQGLQAKFRPIHRLDRNTSGLVLKVKTSLPTKACTASLWRDRLGAPTWPWWTATFPICPGRSVPRLVENPAAAWSAGSPRKVKKRLPTT